MALYCFGFKWIRPDESSSSSQEKAIPDVDGLMPSLAEARCLGVSKVEYETVINNASEILSSQNKKQRCARGKYLKYSDDNRAKIGKYAWDNGNERARKHF